MSVRLSAADQLLYRSAAQGDSIPQADSLTACGWMKIVVDRDDDSPIFERYGDSSGTIWNGAYVSPDGSGVRTDNSGGSASATIPIPISVWVWVAYRRKGDVHDLFLNGFHVAQSIGTPAADVVASFAIGGNGLWATNGEFANWKIWEAALSGSELVAELFSVAPVRTASLWADYRIANDALTLDSSGNGRTLRTNGAVSNGASEPEILLSSIRKMRTPHERLPSGGNDVWNQVQASVILNDDVFDAVIQSGTGLVNVWIAGAWAQKPVKVWDGAAWTTKPMKRWNGASWV